MNLNVSLTDDLMKYIEAKVESGRYTSSSEVVQDALRLLEHEDERKARNIRWLKDAWQDGMESGDFGPLDIDAIKEEGRKQLSAKA